MARSRTPKRDDLIPLIAAALPAEYELLRPDGTASTSGLPELLGQGGSSVVFRSAFRERLPRALKVIIPRDDLRESFESFELEKFTASFENEVSQLAQLSHENIAKITDFAAVELDGQSYPYMATEYIEGATLLTYAQAATTTGDQIAKVLTDVLSALDYMHRHGVMHCDLKPDNILVRQDPATKTSVPVGIVVDLGSSRYFPPVPDEREDELLYFYSTQKYVMKQLQYVLSNRTSNRIKRRDMRAHFPYQDLHSFGVILEDLLGSASVASKLESHFGGRYTVALQQVRDRLRSPHPGGKFYHSAHEVADSLARIPPTSVSIFAIPELSVVPHHGIVIPSLRGRASTSPRIDEIISHPFFQRLHNLPQLDMLHLVLPGATHSRYVHALHSYDLVRQAILHLLSDWGFRIEVSREDIESTLFSAILGQLGHYHFLHMFEDFIAERQTDVRIRRLGLLRDDELLDNALGVTESDIGKRLQAVTDSDGRSISQIVEGLGVSWADIKSRASQPQSPLQGVLAALLNCPVDAEKLAYLFDDSSATGVPFGLGIAGAPIFESIIVPREGDWTRHGGVSRIALGVRERSMSYLEHGVLARYWNIQTAYWNRTNRSVQAMIKFQIGALISCGALDFDRFIIETLHLSSDGALRWINDEFCKAEVRGMLEPETVNPIGEVLLSRRAIYKRLITISGKSRIPGREPDHRIFERVRGISPLDDSSLLKTVGRVVESHCSGLHLKPGELLLDLPRPRREEAGGQVLVYTDDGASFMGELFSISPFLSQHRESFELNVKRMRVFVHPRVYEQLTSEGKLQNIYDACLDELRSEFGA